MAKTSIGKKRPGSTAHLAPLLEALRKSQLRITEPRKAIIQVLVDHHGPFTVEEIHQKIPRGVCDLATVYRCMGSIEKAGLIRRCEFGDGAARYELAVSGGHHHHVICTECKKVVVLDDCELDAIDRFAVKRGFSRVTHSLEFFGVCSACR